MRRNSTPSLGALHPILFFFVVYGISLFLALFVCRSVYYTINDDVAKQESPEVSQQTTAVAYR